MYSRLLELFSFVNFVVRVLHYAVTTTHEQQREEGCRNPRYPRLDLHEVRYDERPAHPQQTDRNQCQVADSAKFVSENCSFAQEPSVGVEYHHHLVENELSKSGNATPDLYEDVLQSFEHNLGAVVNDTQDCQYDAPEEEREDIARHQCEDDVALERVERPSRTMEAKECVKGQTMSVKHNVDTY